MGAPSHAGHVLHLIPLPERSTFLERIVEAGPCVWHQGGTQARGGPGPWLGRRETEQEGLGMRRGWPRLRRER